MPRFMLVSNSITIVKNDDKENVSIDDDSSHWAGVTQALSSEAGKASPLETACHGKVFGRAGMAWTAQETKILRDLLDREGEVSESFSKIRRGEDAIKRKWRKVIYSSALTIDSNESDVGRSAGAQESSLASQNRRKVQEEG